MKLLAYSLVFSCLLMACDPDLSKENEKIGETVTVANFQHMSAFDSILLAHEVQGAILILDSVSKKFYGNDSSYSSQGYLPASTFKIPNTLIGLESGVLEDANSMFYWKGEKRFLSSWERDLTLAEAFQASCLPCYQEMARNVGPEQMQGLVQKLDYGEMQVDSENYDQFWVNSRSRISPFEQVHFLQRIYKGDLPHKPIHIQTLKKIMIARQEPGYTLSAKTGWSIEDGYNSGWYVGRLKKRDKVYYFATHVAPVDQEQTDHFAKARISVSMAALDLLE